MKERTGLRRTLLIVAAIGSSVGAYWSGRLAYAELLCTRGTPQSVERAADLAPANVQYARRMAELAEAGLNPVKPENALEAVLRAKPGDAEALIALGIRAELRNDFAAAERDLIEAARHDRGYDPRWSLANYYFRRHDDESFWKWARAACEMAYDPTPLFRLLWNYTDDPAAILDRAIPSQPAILRQYLIFLIDGPHWEAADAVAERILKQPAAGDTQALMAYCNRLLAARRGQDALDVWNRLARWVLANLAPGGFRTPPNGSGFDWRLAPLEGIEASQDRPGLRLYFSGEEPEACEPLWQYVVLNAGARYKMTFQYAAGGLAEGSGLRWRVLDITGAPAVIAESEDLAGEGWKVGSVSFTAPAGMSLGKLALSYRRASGTTRIEGSLRLRNVTLGRAD